MNQKKHTVLVAGAGSWGTALALVLARNHHQVLLWDIDSAHIKQLQQQKQNRKFLPDIDLPESIVAIDDLQSSLARVNDIIVAVPCSGLSDMLEKIAAAKRKYSICLACKGLAPGDYLLNHQVVEQKLPDVDGIAVVSGPSFAGEVARGLPTAVTIASGQQSMAEHFSGLFHNEMFRVYTHDDIIGVQVGGAIKNVMAIAAGIADGLGFGANTRAALITRGLAEIIRLGVALGGKPETFMGLAGLGDLVLTCTDDQSRNRRLGLMLARGLTPDAAQKEIGQTVEGVRTVNEVMKLSARYDIEMPISEQVFNVLNNVTTPADAVQLLLAREPKPEAQ